MATSRKSVGLEKILEPVVDKILEVARMCNDLDMPEPGSPDDDGIYHELHTAVKAALWERRRVK